MKRKRLFVFLVDCGRRAERMKNTENKNRKLSVFSAVRETRTTYAVHAGQQALMSLYRKNGVPAHQDSDTQTSFHSRVTTIFPNYKRQNPVRKHAVFVCRAQNAQLTGEKKIKTFLHFE